MGISDRDYARFGPRSQSGLGNMRVLSVNTWLIIICVAVFILSNWVLPQVQTAITQERFLIPGLPAPVVQAAQVDRRRGEVQQDGTYRYPLTITEQDRSGRVRQTDIGYERVRYMPVISAFGHFSTGKFWTDGQIWRLITFQFLHANLSHIVLNMLGLWFFGGLVEQYLGRRRYAVFYLACGVCGALAYMLLNLAGYLTARVGLPPLPLVLVDDPYVPLVGASAGVFGVMMAAAYIAPSAMVDVMLVIPMRLKTAVYVFLGIAIVNLYVGGNNAGGDAAHVGGAIAGAFLVRRPHVLRDMLSAFGLLRSPSRARLSRRGEPPQPTSGAFSDAARIDALLDKVSEHGVASLSEAERAFLRRAARP